MLPAACVTGTPISQPSGWFLSESDVELTPEGIAVPDLLNMSSATSNSPKPPNSAAPSAVHYTPELLQLLKDTIPLICNSKMETILFFLRTGVPEPWLASMKQQVETCRVNVTKFSIAHHVLEKLNLEKDNHHRERHEIVLRVTGFKDFSTCRPTDRLKAMELVAEVRRVADVMDAFTAMRIDG